MRLSFICALFIFIAIPSFGYSNPTDAGPYDHIYATGYFTPGGSITGKLVNADPTEPKSAELFLGRALRTPPWSNPFGDFYVSSVFSRYSLGLIPPGSVTEIHTTLPTISAQYDLYIQAIIGGKLSNLFVMEVRDFAPSGMVMIPEGDYDMGDHHDGWTDALPAHNVTIDAFLMDIHEVTNRQYCDFLNHAYSLGLIEVIRGIVYKMNDTETFCDTTSNSNYSRITWDDDVFGVTKGKENHPMVTVTWYGAVAYANWRSFQAGLNPCYNTTTWECDFSAGGYRLPTEAEWEKAARGGEHSPYYRYPWGDTADGSMANFVTSGDPYETIPPYTTPVEYYCGSQVPTGADMANGYGLYDMAGNVWEWCNDWYSDTYYSYCVIMGVDDNPTGPSTGFDRVLRGGAWVVGEPYMVNAYRMHHIPDLQAYSFGFRLVKN